MVEMTHPFCTVTATTKRNQTGTGGVTGAAVAYLTALAVTPLWPLRPETIESLGISSPREYKECYHVPTGDALPDIVERDILVHGGAEYIVDHVAEWPDIAGGVPSLQIVVTQVKTAWPTVAAEEP
ncbi:MAG: hypothetical protein WC700_16860 [Gemmatimonadaceae bacterium]|jgi:hypothetical protein